MNIEKPQNIDSSSQLIKGIGASSWFTIKSEGDVYRIERFSPEGKLECSRIIMAEPNTFDINHKYEFTYISHCKECTILQDNKKYIFKTKDYEY
jgi:hypothetical protein